FELVRRRRWSGPPMIWRREVSRYARSFSEAEETKQHARRWRSNDERSENGLPLPQRALPNVATFDASLKKIGRSGALSAPLWSLWSLSRGGAVGLSVCPKLSSQP